MAHNCLWTEFLNKPLLVYLKQILALIWGKRVCIANVCILCTYCLVDVEEARSCYYWSSPKKFVEIPDTAGKKKLSFICREGSVPIKRSYSSMEQQCSVITINGHFFATKYLAQLPFVNCADTDWTYVYALHTWSTRLSWIFRRHLYN